MMSCINCGRHLCAHSGAKFCTLSLLAAQHVTPSRQCRLQFRHIHQFISHKKNSIQLLILYTLVFSLKFYYPYIQSESTVIYLYEPYLHLYIILTPAVRLVYFLHVK